MDANTTMAHANKTLHNHDSNYDRMSLASTSFSFPFFEETGYKFYKMCSPGLFILAFPPEKFDKYVYLVRHVSKHQQLNNFSGLIGG